MSTVKEPTRKPSKAGNVQTGTTATVSRRRKIGVMNPYVLVRLLSPPSESEGKRAPYSILSKIDLDNPETLRLMNAHFKKNRQVKKHWTYKSLRKNLFNPKISPLYKPLKGISAHYIIGRTRRTKGVNIGARDLVGAGAASPAYTNRPDRYGAAPGNPQYIIKNTLNRVEVFGDVIQGAAVDCYFHAALHSTIWVRYSASTPSVIGSIAFYRNFVRTPMAVTATFPLDLSGNLVFAQKSSANEYWAMAYEKAYAEFKGLAKSSLKNAAGVYPTPPYDPEIGNFADSDALDTLTEVAGKAYWPNTAHPNPAARDTTAYKIDATHSPDCYKLLNDYNSQNKNTVLDNNGNPKVISTMTSYPTVAWTKATCPDYSPALVASHAYSILGTFTPDNGTTKYIVLRNPWGINIDTSILAALAQSGDYQPLNIGEAITLGDTLDPPYLKGIFAIKNADFNTYFAGFGWVRYTS